MKLSLAVDELYKITSERRGNHAFDMQLYTTTPILNNIADDFLHTRVISDSNFVR